MISTPSKCPRCENTFFEVVALQNVSNSDSVRYSVDVVRLREVPLGGWCIAERPIALGAGAHRKDGQEDAREIAPQLADASLFLRSRSPG